MSDDLKPALSAALWQKLQWFDFDDDTPDDALPGIYLQLPYGPLALRNDRLLCNESPLDITHDELLEVMAVVNAGLPNGSPYKITREDVAAVIVGAESARRRMLAEGYDFVDAKKYIAALRALTAKLAALLPPEGA